MWKEALLFRAGQSAELSGQRCEVRALSKKLAALCASRRPSSERCQFAPSEGPGACLRTWHGSLCAGLGCTIAHSLLLAAAQRPATFRSSQPSLRAQPAHRGLAGGCQEQAPISIGRCRLLSVALHAFLLNFCCVSALTAGMVVLRGDLVHGL